MKPYLPKILLLLKKFWWIILLLIIIIISSLLLLKKLGSKNDTKKNNQNIENNQNNGNDTSKDQGKSNQYGDTLQYDFLPTCPANLSEVVTHPIMDKGTIKGMIPLGNANPPGHTFPVDHIYFSGDRDGTRHNVYAAGDGMILEASTVTNYALDGSIKPEDVTISIAYCKGVELVNAIPGDFSPKIKEQLRDVKTECKEIPGKHEGESKNKFCYYNDLRIPVKADDVVAITDGDNFPEIWALNKNITLSDDVDWARYNSPYYQYAFCFFDMYPKELKDYYYNLFGVYLDNKDPKKSIDAQFIPRTIEPKCGEVNQNVAGTVKGDWFRTGGKSGQGYTEGADDMALIRDNIDPTFEKFVIGGTITDPVSLIFLPKHTGNINREFSEVKPDGNVYCYYVQNNKTRSDTAYVQEGWSGRGKIVLQLTDSRHLKIEQQSGACTGTEKLINPHNYDR